MLKTQGRAMRMLAIAAALVMAPAIARAAFFVAPDTRYGPVDVDPAKIILHVKVGQGAVAHFTLAQKGNDWDRHDYSGAIRCSVGLLRPPHLDIDGDDVYVIVPRQLLAVQALCKMKIGGLGGRSTVVPIGLDVQL